MSPSHSDEWSKKIGQVFDSRPRIAVDDVSRWIDRIEEKKFRRSVVCPGVHVCLYGPSGSGKTSLAKTILGRLNKKNQKFLYTKINHNSSWESFKSQIIENKQAKNKRGKAAGVKIGIKNLLPYIELEGEVGGSEMYGTLSRSKLVAVLDIPSIAHFLVDNNLFLAIDDTNFATPELQLMLTDLAKEITDNSENSNAKVIFIGADDIFLKLIKVHDSLKDRTEEIPLGSILGDEGESSVVTKDRVWKFICDGLVQLGLKNPGKDENISSVQLKECSRLIEFAADGLPKSIVRLGRTIAEKGEYRSRVSYNDIKNSAGAMTKRNFRYYRSGYRALVSLIKKNGLLQEVCMWMFKRGASRIHRLEDISEDLHSLATYTQFNEATKTLENKEFLIITGGEENVFFARDPLLAHTIGVALMCPDMCGVDSDFFGADPGIKQLLLKFKGVKDPELRQRI